jgi:hypothetical protein
MSCPFARPFAWSHDRGYPCVHGRSRMCVPANDCPLVSPHSLICSSPSPISLCRPAGFDPTWQGRGVEFFPPACPLAWTQCSLLTPIHSCLLPAKEKQKRQHQNTSDQGGGL